MELELRFVSTTLDTSSGSLKVEGLVNKTESWSHVLGTRKKFREKIVKGAFMKALSTENRIDFLAEHNASKILATTENNSLELWEDDEGLKMRAEICPTSYGTDMYELMKSKIVNHMSFGFKVVSDKWKKLSNGVYERVIEELQLLEVSAVRNPAYPQSSITARGFNIVEEVNIPDDVEEEVIKEERNCNMKDKCEKRAYATYLYTREDVINSAMTLVAECSSLSGYLMKYVGEDKDTASVLVSLQNSITMANKIINNEIQVLVDGFNEIDSEIKTKKEVENTDNEVVNETSDDENRSDDNVETSETSEEKHNVENKEVVDNTTEDEHRSFDLSSYKKRLKHKVEVVEVEDEN